MTRRRQLLASTVLAAAILASLVISAAAHEMGDATLGGLALQALAIPVVVAALLFGRVGALVSLAACAGAAATFDLNDYYGPGVLWGYVGVLAVVGGTIGEVSHRRDARRRLRTSLAEMSPTLVAAVDPNGIVAWASEGWVEALGGLELVGNDLATFIHADDRHELLVARYSVSVGGDTARLAVRTFVDHGDERWLELALRGEGETGRVFIVGHDVTEPVDRAVSGRTEALAGRNAALLALANELQVSRHQLLGVLTTVAELRDGPAFGHPRRVATTAQLLATKLGLSEEAARLLGEAATLHDIGLIGLPDEASEALTVDPQDTQLVDGHTRLGARILGGTDVPVLQLAASIALLHHERWDGMGEPCGLEGDRIPLAARIVAVADAFDRLTQEDAELRGLTCAEALEVVRRESGLAFDPGVVAALSRVLGEEGLSVVEAEPRVPHGSW